MIKYKPVIICDLDNAIMRLPDLINKVGFELAESQLALIKPNICGLYHPSLEILSSTVKFLLFKVESVIIGETRSMIHNPREQFERLGISKVLDPFKKRVKTVDLSDDKCIRTRVPRPHVLGELDIPKTILDSDVLVNIPKVGTHSTTRLTCALKNLFGLLPQKHKYSIYHPLGIGEVIADIAQIIKPDLNIVDAGKKVILGIDALAVDLVSCSFSDVNPSMVKHLRLISEDRDENLEGYLKKIKIIKI